MVGKIWNRRCHVQESWIAPAHLLCAPAVVRGFYLYVVKFECTFIEKSVIIVREYIQCHPRPFRPDFEGVQCLLRFTNVTNDAKVKVGNCQNRLRCQILVIDGFGWLNLWPFCIQKLKNKNIFIKKRSETFGSNNLLEASGVCWSRIITFKDERVEWNAYYMTGAIATSWIFKSYYWDKK